ncbi:MAG: Xaa-Pro peptidase family protein [Desulfovibrio sp.]|nr:Xaa-Pro peptidase family protein [Desulfovibrio sp.]MCA1986314.1 Xaa-Pro peptidase family protein [Desulfovibrio sp.]
MNPAIFAARRDRLRPLLAQHSLDALLVTYAANRFYLSGFEQFDCQCNESSGWLLIRQDGRDALFTDPRYEDEALRHWPAEGLVIYKGNELERLPELVASRLTPGDVVGVEDKTLNWHQATELGKAMPLRPAQGLVERLRLYKSPEEIEALRQACALNHAVMDRVPALLTPGKTEAELAWDIEQLFRGMGASGLSFSTIVGVNGNAALPHARPGDTRMEEGCLVLVDTGCRLHHYCSDQTRTFWVGQTPSARFLEVMDQVRTAQQKALDIMRPGVAMLDVYLAARNHFESLGVADRFTHGLGHGIGLETHEAPSLNSRSKGVLEPGMVVTVEPGLYYPEWGGIRWEYMVVITEDGIDIL